MRARVLLLVLLLLPSLADATTWYVRPIAGSYGAEDGTSYANAYKGFADIVWGGAGFLAGDTLYICGAHTEMFTVGLRGTSIAQNIADGACPADAGSIRPGAASVKAINQLSSGPSGENYWTFQNLTLGTGSNSAINCNGSTLTGCLGNIYQDLVITAETSGANVTGIVITNGLNTITRRNTLNGSNGIASQGIRLTGSVGHTGNLIDSNIVHGWADPGIRFQGLDINNPIVNPGTISNNTVYDNGDGIYHNWASGAITHRNITYGNNRTNMIGEGYGLASYASPDGVWTENISYSNLGKGLEVNTDNGAPFTSTLVRGNLIYANTTNNGDFICGMQMQNAGTNVNMPNTTVVGNIVIGSKCGINISKGVTGFVINNTVIDPTAESGIYIGTDAANLVVANNAVRGGAYPAIRTSNGGVAGTVTFSHNFYDTTGATTLARYGLTTYTAGTLTTFEATAVTGVLSFVNETARDYRLAIGSPGRRAGVASSACLDKRGRACGFPPDIGAYQAGSGDPAATRTTRSQYIFQPVASSTFSSGDANPLSESGVWAVDQSGSGSMRISSGIVIPTDRLSDSGARYIGTGFNANQYSRGVLTTTGTLGGGAGHGLSICASSSARTMYRFTVDHAATSNASIYRYIAGVGTLLTGGAWTQTFSDGDQFTVANVGETLYVFRASTLVKTIDDTGGGVGCASTRFPGIAHSSTTTAGNVDGWSGGNFRLAY